jgi:hypothetical protein
MTFLHHDITTTADAASVWDAIRDVGAVHRRFAAGFVTATCVDPDHADERVVTFVNGVEARERIISIDDDRRRLAYSVVESPAGLTHHHGTFTVVADGDGSRLVWDVDLLPADAAPFIDDMMAAGAQAIAATLDGRTAAVDA